MSKNNEIDFDIVENFMTKYFEDNILTEKLVTQFLEDHNIDINVSNGILLYHAMCGLQYEDNINALIAVRILLSLGADPNIKPHHDDIVRYELPNKSRILLEGIYKSFGYNIDFNFGDEYEVVRKQ